MLWVIFMTIVAPIIAFEMGLFSNLFSKKAVKTSIYDKIISTKESMIRLAAYVAISFLFSLLILYNHGVDNFMDYINIYVIEMILSLDNVFVFVLIFMSFATPKKYQYAILFLGVIGALVLRGAFIFFGVEIVNRFHFVLIVFAIILFVSGIQIFIEAINEKESEENPKDGLIFKLISKVFTTTDKYHDHKYFVKINEKQHITPLTVILIMIMITDVIFALDSIPASLAISQDRFIVYSANIFAVIGLRSMFFVLSDAVTKFHYLKHALSVILIFIGVKIVVNYFSHELISNLATLIFVIASMAISILFSIRRKG